MAVLLVLLPASPKSADAIAVVSDNSVEMITAGLGDELLIITEKSTGKMLVFQPQQTGLNLVARTTLIKPGQ